MLILHDQQQLDRALALVREVLGGEIVGAYLFGSAVRGGLRPDSDLDIFVVCSRPTTLAEREQLARQLMAISGKSDPGGMWRRVEVTIAVQSDIKPWRYPPRLDFQYGDWLRDEFEMGNYDPAPPRYRPDLAILISMVLEAKATLIGSPPAAVFDPVPHEDVLRAMVGDLERLRSEIDQDTRNVILTLARMWSTLVTGSIYSKDEAANWVVEQLPASCKPIVIHARDAYLGREAERWDHQSGDVDNCVEYMIAMIKSISAKRSIQL